MTQKVNNEVCKTIIEATNKCNYYKGENGRFYQDRNHLIEIIINDLVKLRATNYIKE